MSFAWRTVTAAADATVAIGLGSNVGDRFDHIARAIAALRQQVGALTALSNVYVTEPVGYREQPDFWNAAALFHTTLEPMSVFEHAKLIEQQLGRAPTFTGGPRIIDIDVLLYGDVVLATPRLEIPHPRMHERAFVLQPLAEIAPEHLHPQLGRSIAELSGDVVAQRAEVLPDESARLRHRLGLSAEV